MAGPTKTTAKTKPRTTITKEKPPVGFIVAATMVE
ncbi:hypothetical protein Rifp1Sym_av00280 [endosymbiont of Riftia pachyptila (vent Ph05)]|uniref:Uncharacterized protein n=1 Tax=endosymbiont of Riftia pachyptila (vent Ph05) TaxID=1048808 RepID=G2DBW1_9GAMM|nr:hypothetical protein Rifp1Sym_av00280 [endosymbiont of Riftia pachyptila (vent Ph05)]